MPAPTTAERKPLSDEQKEKNRLRQSMPKAAYVLVKLPVGVMAADIEVVSVSRKAEDALEAIDNDSADGYLRIMVK